LSPYPTWRLKFANGSSIELLGTTALLPPTKAFSPFWFSQ
jgi:hypothetical protein